MPLKYFLVTEWKLLYWTAWNLQPTESLGYYRQALNWIKDVFWGIRKFEKRLRRLKLSCTSVICQNWVNWIFSKLPLFALFDGLLDQNASFSENSTFFITLTSMITDWMTIYFLYFGETRSYKWEKGIEVKICQKVGNRVISGGPTLKIGFF